MEREAGDREVRFLNSAKRGAGGFDVVLDLDAKLLDGIEATFGSQMVDEFDFNFVSIEVGVVVEQMGFKKGRRIA